MELVYLVNGNESGEGGGGGSSGGYPFVKAVVQDGVVGIQDRTVTRVELKTSDAVRINFPPKTEGIARDFLLRLVITADDGLPRPCGLLLCPEAALRKVPLRVSLHKGFIFRQGFFGYQFGHSVISNSTPPPPRRAQRVSP